MKGQPLSYAETVKSGDVYGLTRKTDRAVKKASKRGYIVSAVSPDQRGLTGIRRTITFTRAG